MNAPRLVLRGGGGPVQPEWDDCQTYSAEWYRRFQAWTLLTYPEVDSVTLDNLAMLVRIGGGG